MHAKFSSRTLPIETAKDTGCLFCLKWEMLFTFSTEMCSVSPVRYIHVRYIYILMIFSASLSVATRSVHSRPFGWFSQFPWKLWDSNLKTRFCLNSFKPYVISCSAKTAVHKASLNYNYPRNEVSVIFNRKWHQMQPSISLSDSHNIFRTIIINLRIYNNRKYGHTIYPSFPTTCFGLLKHHQVYNFLHAPVFICYYSKFGQCLHIGIPIFLVVFIAVKYKCMFTFKVKYYFFKMLIH
jgi:hypothetical protein